MSAAMSLSNAIFPTGYWCKDDTVYMFMGASLAIAGILALYITAKDQQDELNKNAEPKPVPIPTETRQGMYIGIAVLVMFAGFIQLMQLRCLSAGARTRR
jgi:membrane associated rhomboid family serine protease